MSEVDLCTATTDTASFALISRACGDLSLAACVDINLGTAGYIIARRDRVGAAEAIVRNLVKYGLLSVGGLEQAEAWVKANPIV